MKNNNFSLYSINSNDSSKINPKQVKVVKINDETSIINRSFKIMLFRANILLTSNDIHKYSFTDLISIDPQYIFLQKVIKQSKEVVQEELTNAFKFFKEQFGISLEQFKPKDQKFYYHSHSFFGFFVNPSINYHTISITDSNTSSIVDGIVSDGGFVFIVGEPGLIAYGKYGGTNGRLIQAGSIIKWGYYKLSGKSFQPSKIIHYRTKHPYLPNNNHIIDVFDFSSKLWGKSSINFIHLSLNNQNNLLLQNTLIFHSSS